MGDAEKISKSEESSYTCLFLSGVEIIELGELGPCTVLPSAVLLVQMSPHPCTRLEEPMAGWEFTFETNHCTTTWIWGANDTLHKLLRVSVKYSTIPIPRQFHR